MFEGEFKSNITSILIGPTLKKGPQLIWVNVVKVLLAEIESKESFITNPFRG